MIASAVTAESCPFQEPIKSCEAFQTWIRPLESPAAKKPPAVAAAATVIAGFSQVAGSGAGGGWTESPNSNSGSTFRECRRRNRPEYARRRRRSPRLWAGNGCRSCWSSSVEPPNGISRIESVFPDKVRKYRPRGSTSMTVSSDRKGIKLWHVQSNIMEVVERQGFAGLRHRPSRVGRQRRVDDPDSSVSSGRLSSSNSRGHTWIRSSAPALITSRGLPPTRYSLTAAEWARRVFKAAHWLLITLMRWIDPSEVPT